MSDQVCSVLCPNDAFDGSEPCTLTCVEAEVSECNISAGDTAFMLFATTMVMLQTPAMGLAQAGLIKRKNSLSMLAQTLFGLMVGSMLWMAVGYSLVFSKSQGGFIGDLEWIFLEKVPLDGCLPNLADNIPAMVHMAFQMMFGLMVPVIVTGAWAEKMTFSAFVVFIVLWPVCVYYPLAHWVWNPDGWLLKEGVIDFAGGITIHTAAGVAALVVAFFMQDRKRNKREGAVDHHNLPLFVLGATLIWAGWYSFNAGSALAANAQAADALVSTHLSACFAGFVWVMLSRMHSGAYSLIALTGGALAGLAAITPGSGFVEPQAAAGIGAIAGVVSFYASRAVKEIFKLDDVLDVFALQGAPGMTGSILAGLFAVERVGGVDGAFYGGGWDLFGWQCLAVFLAALWTAFWTTLIMLVIKFTVGMDVSPEVEESGLDKAQIGEIAYDSELNPLLDLDDDTLTTRLCAAAAMGNLKDIQDLCRAHADPRRGDYDGRTPAHLAASEGRVAILEWLHDRHTVDLSARDKTGATPLNDAVAHKRDHAIAWLTRQDAKLNSEMVLPAFLTAASTGDTQAVSRLVAANIDIDTGDYDERTALMVASAEGQSDVVRVLLDHGANVDLTDRWGRTALDDAILHGEEDVARIIRDHGGHCGESRDPSALLQLGTPSGTDMEGGSSADVSTSTRELVVASAAGDIAEVKRLVRKGANPASMDYDGRTPLHLAAAGGHFDVVRFLVTVRVGKGGAKARANVNSQDRWHQTPLQEAVRGGHARVAAFLRAHGATLANVAVGYWLCKAAADGDLAKLRKLQEEGTDMTLCDHDSRTALHLAASGGHAHIVSFLMKHMPTVDVRDRYNNTPADDAKRSGHTKLAVRLSSHDTGSSRAGAALSSSDSESDSSSDDGLAPTGSIQDSDGKGMLGAVEDESNLLELDTPTKLTGKSSGGSSSSSSGKKKKRSKK